VSEFEKILQFVRFYNFRTANLPKLKRYGSDAGFEDRLKDNCENLWSVLRNLHGRQLRDRRYNTIIEFMKKSFPSFEGLVFDQTGRN
jgi:hypothetical protein